MHPALRRHVDPRPFPTRRYVAAGALCGFAGILLTLAIVRLHDVRDANAHQAEIEARPRLASGTDIASRTAEAWSLRGYPAWVVSHPDKACPDRLAELTPYVPEASTRDPWATPYRFDCDGTHFRVRSAGPDRAFFTDDDVGAGQ